MCCEDGKDCSSPPAVSIFAHTLLFPASAVICVHLFFFRDDRPPLAVSDASQEIDFLQPEFHHPLPVIDSHYNLLPVVFLLRFRSLRAIVSLSQVSVCDETTQKTQGIQFFACSEADMAVKVRSAIFAFSLILVLIMTSGGVVSSSRRNPSSHSLSSSPQFFAAPLASGRSSDSPVKLFTQLERLFRQLPSLWSGWSKGNTAVSRQVFDMIDIVTDVAMLTIIGIPILGLVAVGATALSPLLGSSAGRKKRDADQSTGGFMDRAGKAILYTRTLYDIVSDLEDMFEKYDIKSNDCQLRSICEVHR